MYAAKIGNRALGVSFDEAQLEKASRRAAILRLGTAQFQRVDLRELDRFTDILGRFEQIMCLECIEHIPDDRKLVSDLASLLAPAGVLIISTPYKYHKAYYNEALSPAEDGGHVRWGYTHDELQKMLADEGLTVVAIDSYHGFVAQKLINFRLRSLANLPAIVAWPLIWLSRPLNTLDKPLTTLLKYPYLSIGVVAVKDVNYQPKYSSPALSEEPVQMFLHDCVNTHIKDVSAVVVAAAIGNLVRHA
jgi:SAM-dependent methyltransferase